MRAVFQRGSFLLRRGRSWPPPIIAVLFFPGVEAGGRIPQALSSPVLRGRLSRGRCPRSCHRPGVETAGWAPVASVSAPRCPSLPIFSPRVERGGGKTRMTNEAAPLLSNTGGRHRCDVALRKPTHRRPDRPAGRKARHPGRRCSLPQGGMVTARPPPSEVVAGVIGKVIVAVVEVVMGCGAPVFLGREPGPEHPEGDPGQCDDPPHPLSLPAAARSRQGPKGGFDLHSTSKRWISTFCLGKDWFQAPPFPENTVPPRRLSENSALVDYRPHQCSRAMAHGCE